MRHTDGRKLDHKTLEALRIALRTLNVYWLREAIRRLRQIIAELEPRIAVDMDRYLPSLPGFAVGLHLGGRRTQRTCHFGLYWRTYFP